MDAVINKFSLMNIVQTRWKRVISKYDLETFEHNTYKFYNRMQIIRKNLNNIIIVTACVENINLFRLRRFSSFH